MHDCYGIHNESGEWFTGDSRTGAAFTTIEVSVRTCRYTQAYAARIVAQLARNEPPVHATMHPLPPLTDAEAQERDAMRNPPPPRRPRRSKVGR